MCKWCIRWLGRIRSHGRQTVESAGWRLTALTLNLLFVATVARPLSLEGVLKRGAYEHAARASESAPMKIHSLARRACITQTAMVVLGSRLEKSLLIHALASVVTIKVSARGTAAIDRIFFPTSQRADTPMCKPDKLVPRSLPATVVV